ncbi:condensation domain-containing protein [Pontibacter sp. G13]|uniref:condensation domain-containing protein n=1 Tax=Pontibacter sp. G13 TaxID=3074898 RepID=UPI00288AE822|nr:condensation domain-containing protein [Pontibacter sp. G13]WNJ20599.1 condensation domain-containing protein [Pontibacter sp. G13]
MSQQSTFIRSLNPIEQAFTISNQAFPMQVVSVLHVSPIPSEETLAQALSILQARHELLRAGIRGMAFQGLVPETPIPLIVAPRPDDGSWEAWAQKALNAPFDQGGPLMKCTLVSDELSDRGEMILSFHHAIIDGNSARLLLHELLSILGKEALPAPERLETEPIFPTDFRGWKLGKNLAAFMGRQAREEWQYRKVGLKSPIPTDAQNAIISITLPQDVSRRLTWKIGKLGLSLNSYLLSEIALATIRHRHQLKKASKARLISFADLRSGLVPAVSRNPLGCYVSMLRASVPIASLANSTELARNIRRAMFKAGRNGEPFIMSWMSRYLMKFVLKARNMRLGVVALSFIGKLDLQRHYGEISLHNVNAYITNNPMGPEIGVFGKILFGSISLDFTYLPAETSHEQAQELVAEILQKLHEMAHSDLPEEVATSN